MNEPDEIPVTRLNQALAAQLARALGAETVYDHGLPRDFTDPTVLWPCWEQWAPDRDWAIHVYRAAEGGFAATVWEWTPGPRRRGSTVAEAVARAWLASLGGLTEAWWRQQSADERDDAPQADDDDGA